MTKTIHLVSSLVVASLLAIGLHGCSDDAQQAALDRKNKSEQQAADAAAAAKTLRR